MRSELWVLRMDDNYLYDAADLFKLFADSTRIRILYALSFEELSVGEIARRLQMNQSAVSHQLTILKSGKLIKNRREGKTIFYSLADSHVINIIAQGLEHVRE